MAETARSGVNERRAPNDAGSSPAWVKQRTRPRARLASRTGVLHGKMSSLDYLDLCRLCLVKDRVSVPIFEGEGDVRQIFLKIAACLPVKVAREDKLPKKICDDCVYKVELFYQFWNTTANAEKQLLQWLGEVGLEEKQGYVTGVLNPSVMKQEQNSESRLDSNVMQQVSGHQDNMGGMTMIDNMGLGMPIMIPSGNQQQITSVPMDTSGNSVQTVRPVQQAVVAVAGPSAQPNHQEQLAQNQGSASATAGTGTNPTTATPTVVTASISHQDDEEDTTDEDENSDEECDADEGLPVKEESEEDPSNNRTIEPTTFVNVSLACDEAGPSGLQQQKITEMPEMSMPQAADGDPKSGEKEPPIVVTRQANYEEINAASRRKRNRRKKVAPFYSPLLPTDHDSKQHPRAAKNSKMKETLRSRRKPRTNSKAKPLIACEEASEDINDSSVCTRKRMRMRIRSSRRRRKRRRARSQIKTREAVTSGSDEDEHGIFEVSEMSGMSGMSEISEMSETFEGESDSNSNGFVEQEESSGQRKRSKKKGGYACPICEVSFKLRGLYNKHMVTHSDMRPYECQTCQKKFKYNFGLKKHTKEQHSDSAPLYACKMCEFTTKHYPYLQEHFTRKHTDDYKYKCNFCGKKFKVEPDYKVHMSDHETGPQVCDICGVSYPNKSSLYYHRNYMHTEKKKSFECKICKKKLQTEKNLESHMQQHEQTYVCEECGMKFARKYGLTKHRRVHTGEKSHLCSVCGKAFACMATQRVHFLTHAGVRPYVCDVCGLNFTQRSSLMLHWKKKHPDASDPPPPVTLKNILETIKSNMDYDGKTATNQ
ncbi:zinc finger protein 37 isoform X6 [Cephus cinctus]|uniref:Zinc finger protein 37 isoform X6 n=1 Tax=Cephus cinctus TaxID=211228 RepID=A0AAJ7BMM3_CEPCN|nr:zinc finger protein 37 isoform X6 [Cephus cinctus]